MFSKNWCFFGDIESWGTRRKAAKTDQQIKIEKIDRIKKTPTISFVSVFFILSG